MTRPDPSEYNKYYQKYIDLVGGEPLDSLRSGREAMKALLSAVSEDESLVLHPPYTWTAKQVVGHLMDSERIFAYRALRIARGDATPLPGFEENNYVRVAGFNGRSLASLAGEYDSIRGATLTFLGSLDNESFGRVGSANNSAISVRALGFILAGHELHHGSILRKRLAIS